MIIIKSPPILMLLFLFTVAYFISFHFHLIARPCFQSNSLEGSIADNKKALEICDCITSDHRSGQRVLGEEQFHTLRGLLSERVRWHRSMGHWELQVLWCDALQHLLAGDPHELDCRLSASLLKCDALISIGKVADALGIAARCVEIMPSTRTLLMHFKAMLFSDLSGDDVVKAVCTPAAGSVSAVTSGGAASVGDKSSCLGSLLPSDAASPREQLIKFILCCQVAAQEAAVPYSRRMSIACQLLKRWLLVYASTQAWRLERQAAPYPAGYEEGKMHSYSMIGVSKGDGVDAGVPSDTGDDFRPTYLGVVCDMFNIFLERNLQSRMNTLPTSASAISATTTAHPGMGNARVGEKDPSKLVQATDRGTAMDVDEVEEVKGGNSGCPSDSPSAADHDCGPMAASTTAHATAVVVAAKDTFSPTLQSFPQRSLSPAGVDCDDFFTTSGYPECINSDSPSQHRTYAFRCSLGILRADLLAVFEDAVALLKAVQRDDEDACSISVIGTQEDLHWLHNLSWNIGLLLLQPEKCFISSSRANALSSELSALDIIEGLSSGSNSIDRLLTAAQLFEISEHLRQVAHSSSSEQCDGSRVEDQARCLVLAAAARIEVEDSRLAGEHGYLESALMDGSSSTRAAAGIAADDPLPVHSTAVVMSSITPDSLLHSRGELPAGGLPRSATSTTIHTSALTTAQGTLECRGGPISGPSSMNLEIARVNAQRAQRLLRAQADFEDCRGKLLRKTALLLEFTVLCLWRDSGQCKAFLSERQGSFLGLSAADLKTCADRAKRSHGISTEVTRILLGYALQVCTREVDMSNLETAGHQDMDTLASADNGSAAERSGEDDDGIEACKGGIEHENVGSCVRGSVNSGLWLMSNLYRQLIELSPTRQSALEKVEEFEQLARSVQQEGTALDCEYDTTIGEEGKRSDPAALASDPAATSGGVVDAHDTRVQHHHHQSRSPFNTADVDKIVTLAYNYGVTLVDLDQVHLAEKFVARAISLLRHASPSLREWLPRMQVRILLCIADPPPPPSPHTHHHHHHRSFTTLVACYVHSCETKPRSFPSLIVLGNAFIYMYLYANFSRTRMHMCCKPSRAPVNTAQSDTP